jgi:hypothetical protein
MQLQMILKRKLKDLLSNYPTIQSNRTVREKYFVIN